MADLAAAGLKWVTVLGPATTQSLHVLSVACKVSQEEVSERKKALAEELHSLSEQ